VKVLFSLLILRGLLRQDAHRNPVCEIPFLLDEIQALDSANRESVMVMARNRGFIAITASPESVSEVEWLYFLQSLHGKILLKEQHRFRIEKKGLV
jgi:hypothetical protein